MGEGSLNCSPQLSKLLGKLEGYIEVEAKWNAV